MKKTTIKKVKRRCLTLELRRYFPNEIPRESKTLNKN